MWVCIPSIIENYPTTYLGIQLLGTDSSLPFSKYNFITHFRVI